MLSMSMFLHWNFRAESLRAQITVIEEGALEVLGLDMVPNVAPLDVGAAVTQGAVKLAASVALSFHKLIQLVGVREWA